MQNFKIGNMIGDNNLRPTEELGRVPGIILVVGTVVAAPAAAGVVLKMTIL